MTETKRTLKDYALQILREMLSPAEKPASAAQTAPAAMPKTLADIKQEDLEKEKTRLDRKEREMMERLKEIENQKLTLFAEGVKKASEVERAVLARKIKEMDEEAQSVNSMMQIVSKQKRAIHLVILAKERAHLLSKSGLISMGDINLEDLMDNIEEIGLESDVKSESLDRLLRGLGKSKDLSPKLQEDADVLEIMRAMERAHSAAEANPEAASQEVLRQTLSGLNQNKKDTETPEGEF